VNRQTKRLLKRQGQSPDGAPVATKPRERPAPPVRRERIGARQYGREVRAELRKVAWPTRGEVVNSTVIVLIAVTVMTSLIFGIDYVSAKFVLFLFD
jgi:preprotein translocase subunit SecE